MIWATSDKFRAAADYITEASALFWPAAEVTPAAAIFEPERKLKLCPLQRQLNSLQRVTCQKRMQSAPAAVCLTRGETARNAC